MTVNNTTTFAKQAMEHTQATVREAAVNLIHQLYKLKGSEVIGHLPAQDDPKVLANKAIYGRLFKGLSKFVVSQIKVCRPIYGIKILHCPQQPTCNFLYFSCLFWVFFLKTCILEFICLPVMMPLNNIKR